MSYNDTRKHPDYSGVIPDKVDRSKGISITFDAGTVLNADSVTVAFGVDTNLNYIWSKTFAANAGKVNIPAADLSSLPADRYGIIILPFTYTIKNFGGNPYAFIRSKEITRSVTVK